MVGNRLTIDMYFIWPHFKNYPFKAPSRQQHSFAKTHTYCIVLANHPYGSWKRSAWKRTVLKTGLGVEKSENAALPFSCGWRICILSKTMMPSPHPATSHNNNNNNNNNNGRLHARVHAAEDIEPFLQLTHLVVECELQQQFNLINGPHKRFWFPCTSHFHLLVVIFSFSVYSLFFLQCACLMRMLRVFFSVFGEYQAPPIGWNMNYSVFGCFQ